jgi:transposase-like protein
VGRDHAALGAVSGPPACPFCGAAAVERIGQWGGQIITSQWRCQACNSYFEALREDFDDPLSVDPRHGPDR